MHWLSSIILSLLAMALACCGQNKIEVSSLPQFRYYIESKLTGRLENTLIIEGGNTEQLKFMLSGTGFSADVPLNEELSLKPRVQLRYKELGDYSAKIHFFKADGTPLLQDTLKWSYSLSKPENPIAGFSSSAGHEFRVVLLVAESRDPGTNEIWVEGDLAADDLPRGSWREIPPSSKVPLHLSEGDGLKQIKFKLRNAYKNETEFKSAEILIKTEGPSNCQLETSGKGTVNRFFELKLSADNEGPVFYRVFGDLEEPMDFQKFTAKSMRVPLKLSKGAGEKKLTVQIRDEAENYCLREDLKIVSDPNYVSEGIQVKDKQSWSESSQVNLEAWTDHFSDDSIEMYVHGDIIADDNSFRWIPFKPDLSVQLQESDGNRWVRIQFRINGQTSNFRYTPIYLRPSLRVQTGSESPYTLVPANFVNLKSLTLTGCREAYQDVAYAPSFKCNPIAQVASIVYKLSDGSSLTKSVQFPP